MNKNEAVTFVKKKWMLILVPIIGIAMIYSVFTNSMSNTQQKDAGRATTSGGALYGADENEVTQRQRDLVAEREAREVARSDADGSPNIGAALLTPIVPELAQPVPPIEIEPVQPTVSEMNEASRDLNEARDDRVDRKMAAAAKIRALEALIGVSETAQFPGGMAEIGDGGDTPQDQTELSESSASGITSGIQRGEIVSVMLVTGINSDVTGPVMAEDENGVKWLGEASRSSPERVSIKFAERILTDGQSVPINAVALDAKDRSVAVRGKLNRHWVANISQGVSLATLGYLSGFRSGAQRTVLSSSEVSFDAGRAFTTEVASTAADTVSRSIGRGQRPPTLIVKPGITLQLLVL